MTAFGNELAFKEISIVPDFRALQIITENLVELKSFLKNGGENGSSLILKSIYNGHEHKRFLKQVDKVQLYLAKKCALPTLNSNTAALITAELKSSPNSFSNEEIVMILNQLPLPDQTHLEMMFPGKFSKDQARAVIEQLNRHLDIYQQMPSEEKEEES